MRILALDVGEKNIGLAVSDELGWTAQGLSSLRHQTKEKDIASIVELIREKQICEVIVGMPINMNGTLGKKAQEVAIFLADLRKQIKLPVKAWDERLTSLQAEKVMLEADISRKKRKRKIDQLAAQLILQSYLDAKSAS